MQANFPACLQIILASEGGFSDDPADPGGVTNLGVTLKTWSGFIGHTASIADMQALTQADVEPLYRQEYWAVCHCDDLPAGVDLIIFDEAVNAGPGRARRTLQNSVGMTVDGIIGPKTMAAVAACKAGALIDAIATAREAYYRSLPTFGRFGHGWLNRLNRTAALAQQMVAP